MGAAKDRRKPGARGTTKSKDIGSCKGWGWEGMLQKSKKRNKGGKCLLNLETVLVWAAITDTTTNIYFPQFWEPEVGDQGDSMVGLAKALLLL